MAQEERRARAFGERTRRFCRRVRLLLGLERLAERRVDLRDGCSLESSSATAALVEPFFFRLRAALEPAPALRSVALTPGRDVSTPTSRRGFGGCFGRLGFDRSTS